MNQKEIAEIKKRLSPETRYPSVICGRYVTMDGEILNDFKKTVGLLSQEELAGWMGLFKKCLSGVQGQNLLEIGFSAAQTMEDEAHTRLMRLRNSSLDDENALESLYADIINGLQSEYQDHLQSVDAQRKQSNWLIVLMHDSFDQYRKRPDGEVDRDQSDTVFSYILCAVCPVRQGKAVLSWDMAVQSFGVITSGWQVAAPEMGLLFPAMEQGAADIYTSLFYTRDVRLSHASFSNTVFHAEASMPAAEQKATLQEMLQDTLQEECSMELMQAVHECVSDMIREQKADKQADPLQMSRMDMTRVLEDCGVSQEKASAFDQKYTDVFGSMTEIPAVNLIAPKEFKVSTPSVSIKVDPDHRDLVSTKLIDGQRYIMILADGNVEVNGISIAIT